MRVVVRQGFYCSTEIFWVVYHIFYVCIIKGCQSLWFESSVHAVQGFQKKFGYGWVGGGELYPVSFWNFAKPLNHLINRAQP